MLDQTPGSTCPCCSLQPYQSCCKPLHNGVPAATAEQLMRSRYSAYVLGLIDYLVDTTLPTQQAQLDREAIAQWSRSSTWLGLNVEQANPCGPGILQAQVTFTARWAGPDGKPHSHRECSDFRRQADRWYFIDPNYSIKIGRNQPCPCGSGRKYKQCCAT